MRGLVETHAKATDSALALRLLNEWDVEVGKFWHVVPSEIIPLLAPPLTDAVDAAGGAQIA